MKRLIIMSGVTTVGKSEYIEDNYENATVIDGSEYEQIKDAMAQGDDVIVANDTFLSRSDRLNFLGEVDPKTHGYNIEIVQLHKPLGVLYDQNIKNGEPVPNARIRQEYLRMQPPKIDLDCDEHILIAPKMAEYESEIADESEGHIERTLNAVYKGEDILLPQIAFWHNRGEKLADTPNSNANLSAMYYRLAHGMLDDVVDAVLHQNSTEEMLNQDNVSERSRNLINGFRKIDQAIASESLTDEDVRDLNHNEQIL